MITVGDCDISNVNLRGCYSWSNTNKKSFRLSLLKWSDALCSFVFYIRLDDNLLLKEYYIVPISLYCFDSFVSAPKVWVKYLLALIP